MSEVKLRDVYRDAVRTLKGAAINGATIDARRLVLDGLGLTRDAMLRDPDLLIGASDQTCIASLVARRAQREPVSRILGYREFYGRAFHITPDVLDPRPETELLIDVVCEAVRSGELKPDARVIDMGTGSGCLAITLLAEFRAMTAVGVDVSSAALRV
ncbi:MAG: 50S ribosomal protein L11 methyltransferase, partial [Pseudomonadota bacterium]